MSILALHSNEQLKNSLVKAVTASKKTGAAPEILEEGSSKENHSLDSIEISEEGRLAAEKEKTDQAGGEDSDEDVSESQSGKVAVNQNKRARQIAAAKSKSQVQQVIALLQKDMSDCKAGLEQGMCDEAEIAKVQALLNQAQARLSQVPQEAEEEFGISEFDLAELM